MSIEQVAREFFPHLTPNCAIRLVCTLLDIYDK